MKRTMVSAVIFVFLSVWLLNGCISIPQYTTFDISSEEVESVVVFDFSGFESRDSYLLRDEIPVYEVEEEKIPDFLSDLSKIQFSEHIIVGVMAWDPIFKYGEWTVRINYSDGTYEFISCAGYGETCDEDGEVVSCHHFSCDEQEWSKFIGKHIPDDIFNHKQY